MTEENTQQKPDQPQPKKRGRKKKSIYGDNAPEFFRKFFLFLKEIEQHYHKMEIEKPEILQIAREQNIPSNLAELVLNIIELHLSLVEKNRLIEDIKEKVS